jgi:deazaflavin-dependent oxidoreductase (nitroreductase family)
LSDWNNNVIEEFRENDGRVGGPFQDKPVLLLHHKGARTGTQRVSPLMYQTVENGFAVFASKGGAEENPDWYYNLRANPEIEVEIGSETLPVKARVAHGDERERIWEKQKVSHPQFAGYEAKTSRAVIPVVVLEPR